MSDDLIKRSDAIKALEREKSDWNCDYNVPIDNCIKRLNKVKSVDIPHSNDWEKYSDKLWKNAYDRGKADRPQGWIPCSERLPKASITAPCLMTMIFPRAQAVEIAYGYRHHEDVWEYATFEGYEYTESGIAEVVAWMPLPKPWKGADDES